MLKPFDFDRLIEWVHYTVDYLLLGDILFTEDDIEESSLIYTFPLALKELSLLINFLCGDPDPNKDSFYCV